MNKKEYKMDDNLIALYDKLMVFQGAKEESLKRRGFWGRIDRDLFKTAHECFGEAFAAFWKRVNRQFPDTVGKNAIAVREEGNYIIYYYE